MKTINSSKENYSSEGNFLDEEYGSSSDQLIGIKAKNIP